MESADVFTLTPGYVGGVAGNTGLALWVRDGNLLSYSRKVNLIEEDWNPGTQSYDMRLLDPANRYYSPSVTRTVDWSLIYTFANVDGNVFMHPGGNPDDPTKGIVADVVLMSQTFDTVSPGEQGFNWDKGPPDGCLQSVSVHRLTILIHKPLFVLLRHEA